MVGGTSMSDVEANVDLLDDVELVDIEDVYPYSQNAKEHPEEQIDDLVGRIRKEGWDVPIVTDEEGEIVKGHGRLRAAKRLDLDRVPVLRNSYETEADKRAARIADNRVAESEWDSDLLSVEVEYLDEVDYAVDTLGFDEDELEDYRDLAAPPEPDVPVEEHSRSEPGKGESTDELRVVVIAEDEDEANEVGEWAHENGFEWHIVDG